MENQWREAFLIVINPSIKEIQICREEISEASENLDPEERNISSWNRDLDEIFLHLNINITIVILCFRHYFYASSELLNLMIVYLDFHNYPEMFIWFNVEVKRLKTRCGLFLHKIIQQRISFFTKYTYYFPCEH